MTKDAAREARRETLEDLIEALRAIGLRVIPGKATEALGRANQCVGRLQGIDELEFHRDECERGLRARFPRPAVELGRIEAMNEMGVEIDPLLTPAQVEAALYEARQAELEEAAEAFDLAEEEESVEELCDALDRAAEGQRGG
jgi:hypothetical protein